MNTSARALAAVAAVVIVSPAAAEMQCGPADVVLKELREKYGEVPAFTGSVPSASMMITVSPKGTWSVIVQPNPTVVCFIASGEGWTVAKPEDMPKVEPQKADPLYPHWFYPDRLRGV